MAGSECNGNNYNYIYFIYWKVSENLINIQIKDQSGRIFSPIFNF